MTRRRTTTLAMLLLAGLALLACTNTERNEQTVTHSPIWDLLEDITATPLTPGGLHRLTGAPLTATDTNRYEYNGPPITSPHGVHITAVVTGGQGQFAYITLGDNGCLTPTQATARYTHLTFDGFSHPEIPTHTASYSMRARPDITVSLDFLQRTDCLTGLGIEHSTGSVA